MLRGLNTGYCTPTPRFTDHCGRGLMLRFWVNDESGVMVNVRVNELCTGSSNVTPPVVYALRRPLCQML